MTSIIPCPENPSRFCFMGEIAVLDRDQVLQQQGLYASTPAPSAEHLNMLFNLPTVAEPAPSSVTEVAPPEDAWVSQEKYAHSLRLWEKLGSAALAGNCEAQEVARLKDALYQEWRASIVEMLNSDRELREKLEVNHEAFYKRRNGQVIVSDAEGNYTPMVDVVVRGAQRSAEEAQKNPNMQFQAERDLGDVSNAQAVDKLAPGTLRIVVSMDPKGAFKQLGQNFVEGLGYREGWGSLQGYWCTPDDEFVATLTKTFNHSDMQTMMRVWAQAGRTIPEGVTEGTFINYDITVPCGDLDQARDFMDQLRNQSYALQGITGKRQSVDEFLDMNEDVVRQVFDSQGLALATAHVTKQKDENIQALTTALLAAPEGLSSQTRAKLQEISTKTHLHDGDIRLVEFLIRYGVVEHLRKGLEGVAFDQAPRKVNVLFAPVGLSQLESMANSLARNALIGIRNGRTYGGCHAEIELFDKDKTPPYMPKPQDAYGGNEDSDSSSGDRRSWKLKWDVCGVSTCPTRGDRPDQPQKTLCGPCGVCMKRCQKIFDAKPNVDIENVGKSVFGLTV